jgi:hypothetical protein
MDEDPELREIAEVLRETRRTLEANRPPGASYGRLFDLDDLPSRTEQISGRSRRWWREAMLDVTQPASRSLLATKALRDDLEAESPATGEVRSRGRLSQAQRKVAYRLAKLHPAPVLTGTAALAAVGTKFRGGTVVELIWRERERLGGLARQASRLLVDRPHQCIDLGGTQRERRFRFTGSYCLDIEVLLVADPRPPLVAPIHVQFGGIAMATDRLRAVCASLLERLVQRPDVEDLFRLELCLKAGADLEKSLKDLSTLSAATDALDLVWALRTLDQRRAAGTDPAWAHLGPGWRLALSVFLWRLQRRLLDLA